MLFAQELLEVGRSNSRQFFEFWYNGIVTQDDDVTFYNYVNQVSVLIAKISGGKISER